MQGVDQSLKRLQLDHIDLYQIHGRDPFTPLEETLDALDDCVRAGKVRYLGLCNLSAWEIAKSLWISDKKNLARFESLQMYYSVVGRDIEREIVPLAKDQNLAILPWSPLPGACCPASSRARTRSRRRTSRDARFPAGGTERLWRVLDVMRPIAADNRVSVAQVALAWLLAQPHVTSVIIGAKNQEQLLDNIGASEAHARCRTLKAITRRRRCPANIRSGCCRASRPTVGAGARESVKTGPGAHDGSIGFLVALPPLTSRGDVLRYRYRHVQCQSRHRRRQRHRGRTGLRAAERFPAARGWSEQNPATGGAPPTLPSRRCRPAAARR
jgi:diketogulonate reductase-like aldo/keto reductase